MGISEMLLGWHLKREAISAQQAIPPVAGPGLGNCLLLQVPVEIPLSAVISRLARQYTYWSATC